MTQTNSESTRRGFLKTSGTVAGAATALAAVGMSGEAQAHTVEINAQRPTAEQSQALPNS